MRREARQVPVAPGTATFMPCLQELFSPCAAVRRAVRLVSSERARECTCCRTHCQATPAWPPRQQDGKAANAALSASRRACASTSAGTQSGNGSDLTTCRPEAVCSSASRASCSGRKCPALRVSAGHSRRCTSVILPATSRQTRTWLEARTARVMEKISLLRGCDHQLPCMVSPATASTRQGTLPCAASSTMPC